jgi:SAM-dependent methyltransferase
MTTIDIERRPDREGVRDRSVGRLRRGITFVRKLGVGELFNLVRAYGLRKSCRFVADNIRFMIAARADRRFDRMHGVDTAGTIPLEFLTIRGANRALGNEYVPTSPKSFAFMARYLPRDPSGYAFIDIGCGKGRVLLLASHYPFSRIVGVEFAGELAAVARLNAGRYRDRARRCPAVDVVEADATAFEFPPAPMVVYLYNPFDRDVLARVVDNLAASLTTVPRDCIVIYATSTFATMPWVRTTLAEAGFVESTDAQPMPWFWDSVRPLKCAVFRKADR